MECPAIFIFVGFIIAVIAATAVSRKHQTDETYSQLAGRYGGTFESGGWFGQPKVRFPHADTLVTIDIYSTGGKHPTYFTQAHFFFAYGHAPTVRCEVYPDGVWYRLKKLFGMQDIEIGSPEFDERYIIQGDDGAGLRELLSASVQFKIEELRRFLGNDDIYVSFDRRELLVKKRSFIKDFAMLLRFTELAKQLYDISVRPSDEGIEIVKDAPPPELKEAVCQICGETIETDVVFCRRCRTPHHHDCWQYYGACSTYGCLEKRYLRPESRRAQRAQAKMRE